MESKRLKFSNDNLFAKAMELYGSSFPTHEQREASSQIEILQRSEYHFDLLFEEEVFVGIVLYWETDSFIYIEHFCIDPLLRNKRYGQKTLEMLQTKGKTIILEIDPPIDEISQKRKSFYERAGFQENPYTHIHPPYHQNLNGHMLTVMSFPHQLDCVSYNKFHDYLQHTVMA